jgi:hypothetical protein
MQKNTLSRRVFTRLFLGCALAGSAALPLRAADYPSTVLADSPKAYYRLSDDTTRNKINQNIGSLGAAGNATNDLGLEHSFPGVILGDRDRAAFFDFASRAEIPWNAAINPPNTQPFTVEAWFYPASDQTATGQCPINNRYAYGGVDRQGWVFFQRKPSTDYDGGEQVGWNFRMFRGVGGNSGLDVTSLVPYEVGKWTHVVVVYEPNNVTDASVTMYINGVAANTNVWTGGSDGTEPGYVANTNDHAPSEAVDGPAKLALGNYNNTALGSLNPFFGGIDEFAFYAAKLTPEQILAHYQNALNPARTTSYEALIQADHPVVYLRMNEIPPGADTAINYGETRAAGLATHTAEVRHPAASALDKRFEDGSAAYHYRNGNSTTTMPYLADNNPDAGIPFTFETWIRPMSDKQGGQAPFNNRWVGGTGRTGWVVFQRNPNATYPASEGLGWNFRMYSGDGTSGQDILTETDYTVGEWQHLVFTWQPQTDNGDPGGNGNHQWQGILTAYVNGVPVNTNESALYAANRAETETSAPAADLAIGSYNAASTLGNNPFEGDIDEVALYNNYVLTPDQILAHYQAGTNLFLGGTNYETLVLTAPFTGPERQGPKTYLRFNDTARYPAINSGTLGVAADGNLVRVANDSAGPRAPGFAGFESSNTAVALDGAKQWASLNNPSGLNISGQITLEAWVKPSATQGAKARIVSHGPPTLSDFLAADPPLETNASLLIGNEVFLRIDDSGANYMAGSSDGIVTNGVSFAVPSGDLGSTTWIHLAATYNGTHWKLYRNGVEVASALSAIGALPLGNNGDWAIGATGNGWADNFAGSIDEVAIYSTALPPERIAAHYTSGKDGQQATLTIERVSSTQVKITWGGGTLQETSTINGKFSNVPGSPVSPLTIDAVGTKFYRLAF